MSHGAALDVMSKLATPLWLVGTDGRVVWCNGAAGSRLGLDDASEGIGLKARLSAAEPAPVAGGIGVDGTLAFSVSGIDRTVRCRLSPAGRMNGFDDDCLLAEASPRGLDGHDADSDITATQLTTLVNHLSHELRTPLNAVVGFSEIIADDLMPSGSAQRYRDYAGEIRAAAAYMLDLINNLLDLARIRAGALELREEMCDLERLVAVTVHMVAPRADSAGVGISVAHGGPVPAVAGDPMLIRQMLTNLIVNAVKFSAPVRGRVEVATRSEADGSLTVMVRDTGIGMRAEQIPQALSPFLQLHHPAAVAEKGSGLGLPLTKALIEQHGGSIAICSAPGSGTEVRLVFPPARVGRPPARPLSS